MNGTAGADALAGNDGINDILAGGEGNDQLFGHGADDFLYGEAGNDTLYGGTGNDVLHGGADNDYLQGEGGNDTLVGGAGNDTLAGGAGDDVFVFNLGDGQDAITADDIEGTDTLSFGAGIALADLRLEKSGNYDLTVQVGANGDQVTLSNWFYPGREGRRVDRFAFADGTVLSRQELLEQKAVNGTAGAEDLSGNDEIKDILAGGGGNDRLFGAGGDDHLFGEAGDDSLYGEGGNDTLVGGTGNDVLYGGAGDDVFQFNLGDGQDVIAADDAAGNNIISFGAGIALSDLSLHKSGNYDLVMKVGAGGDQLTLSSWWYYAASQRVDGIRFADGTALSWQELLEQKAVNGTAGAEDLSGNDEIKDILAGGGGNDRLFGAGGDDHLLGEAGNDNLYGGNDNDLLEGGAGNDTLQGEGGNDTLAGGAGNDTLAGGAGDDIFFFADTLEAETNIDRITDFTSGQDKLHLSKSIFAALPESEALSDSLFAANATGSALDDKDYILYNTTTGALLYDADGNGQGVAVQFATLTNKPEVKASDFVVVG